MNHANKPLAALLVSSALLAGCALGLGPRDGPHRSGEPVKVKDQNCFGPGLAAPGGLDCMRVPVRIEESGTPGTDGFKCTARLGYETLNAYFKRRPPGAEVANRVTWVVVPPHGSAVDYAFDDAAGITMKGPNPVWRRVGRDPQDHKRFSWDATTEKEERVEHEALVTFVARGPSGGTVRGRCVPIDPWIINRTN